ncbi:hypothetical protein BH11PSE1_BH11PSE1_24270 [soil metagenome]
MDILSLAGTLLLAAAQPQSGPVAQPAPQAQAGHVKVFSGRDSSLSISKVGSGKLEISAGKVNEDRPTDFTDAPSADPTAGKVNEERPTDLSDAPPADPTAALLIPAIQKVREAAHRNH